MDVGVAHRIQVRIDARSSVSGLLLQPADPSACLALAHSAGAGMEHPFMEAVAMGLASRGIATLRYQFPYMERGMKRTDPSAICHATVKAAVLEAARRHPRLPLFAGGKSFGGRMTSQIQSTEPLQSVHGLIFFGFPLHPAGKPATARGAHLSDVLVPMLFLQGERDKLAEAALLEQIVAPLSPRARVAMIADADHSFHVPARSGKTDEDVMHSMLDITRTWIEATASP